jgi:hypothetical protein
MVPKKGCNFQMREGFKEHTLSIGQEDPIISSPLFARLILSA